MSERDAARNKEIEAMRGNSTFRLWIALIIFFPFGVLYEAGQFWWQIKQILEERRKP